MSEPTAPDFRRALSKSADYLDSLATTLRDLGGPTTIPHELTQNADDAGNATKIRFTLDADGLTAWNDGTFTDCGTADLTCPWTKPCDLHAFRSFAGRTKAGDSSTTGAFGVGFTSVYQITDRPELLYGSEHWILNELGEENERIVACTGGCGREHRTDGTLFVLPWAREQSELRSRLAVAPVSDDAISQLEDALLGTVGETLLFLQHVTEIDVQARSASRRVERISEGDTVVVSGGETVAEWLMLSADFEDTATAIVSRFPGLIREDRSARVSIAVPVLPTATQGSLYATLPTQSPSGTSGHINASFFPRTDRKSVKFDGTYEAEWNRAAIAAAAEAVGNDATQIAERLGIPAFWDYIGTIVEFAKTTADNQPNPAAEILGSLAEHVPALEVLDTAEGRTAAPLTVLLPRESEIYESAGALAKIGISLPAQHLHQRLFTSNVYNEFGVQVLTGRRVVQALEARGLTKAFDPDLGALVALDIHGILSSLRVLPGATSKIDGVANVALVPCTNGLFAPAAASVWPATDAEATMLASLDHSILVADREIVSELCPDLEQVIPRVDLALVVETIERAAHENRARSAREVLEWLRQHVHELRPGDAERVAGLPIFRTADEELANLAQLSLPHDFQDPIGVAALVHDDLVHNYRDLLVALGATPLDVLEYVSRHAIPAVAAGRISPEQAKSLLRVLASNQDRLESLRDQLGDLGLVPCIDGQLHAASGVHRPCAGTQLLAPELPIADEDGVPPAILEWLGVAAHPRDAALDIAIQRLASGVEYDPRVAMAVLATLKVRPALPDKPPSAWANSAWLPTKRGGTARPRDVLPTNARHLYGRQGSELSLAADFQTSHFDQLAWLGMPRTPSVDVIVAHLKACADLGEAMNNTVYTELGNNAGDRVVRNLADIACVQVQPGVFVRPQVTFWRPAAFGRWATTLPSAWQRYRPFFDAVGVKDEPGPSELAALLAAIQSDYHTDRLDDAGLAAVAECWAQLSRLLEAPDAKQWLETLGRAKSAPDARGVLERPDTLYFEDSRALHTRFGRLANSVISRQHDSWRALEAAGVRRVEDAIQARLIDTTVSPDEHLAERIRDRIAPLYRVIGSETALAHLSKLPLQRAPAVTVVYRAGFYGHVDETPPEPVDAIYLTGEYVLVRADRASDRAIAREISRAIAPDDDPGSLAMKLEPVLRANSTEEADSALDDFGVARLDAQSREASFSPVAVDLDEEHDAPPSDDAMEATRLAAEDVALAIGTDGGRKSSSPHPAAYRDGASRERNGSPPQGRQTRLRSYVVHTDDDEDLHGTIGDEAPDFTPVDAAGVRRVMEHEQSSGRMPIEMDHNNAGFDVESRDHDGNVLRRIEIKSTMREWTDAGVMLSRRQHQQATQDGETFWLYVVERALDDNFVIHRINNPAAKIDYFGFDGGWRAAAEPDVALDETGRPAVASTRRLLGRWQAD
jgi:Domain of unknown function (DUF3883)